MRKPILYIVIPCYNEEAVLPVMAPVFLEKLSQLTETEKISPDSRILFVDDGSRDKTWRIIQDLSHKDRRYQGISLSRNRGHQNALLCGLMEAKNLCDITISIDCDGQDDINAMDKMVKEYMAGSDIVYGVRNDRTTDTVFKRNTALVFYKLMGALGGEVVYNHADYRLASSRVLRELENYREVNLYLRGMFPLVGFKSTSVYYKRAERAAGKSHYSLGKMLALAMNGITSMSTKPLGLVLGLGCALSLGGFVALWWTLIVHWLGNPGLWGVGVSIACLLAGLQILCLGVVGEYIGKTYMEVKGRPRYIVAGRTWEERTEK